VSKSFSLSRFSKKTFLALSATYCVVLLLIFLRVYLENYLPSDGLRLANGREVGGDFSCFYIAGKIARENPEKLYDFFTQERLGQELFKGSDVKLKFLPFIYPPLVGLFFSVLSTLSLLDAFLSWTAISILLFSLSTLTVLSFSKIKTKEKVFYFLGSLSFPPFFLDCLGTGQTSVLGLAIFSGAYVSLKTERNLLAGILLSLGYYKPPLFVFFALWLVIEKRWHTLLGGILGGTALLIGTVSWFGIEGLLNFFTQASKYTYGTELLPGVVLPPGKGVGLYALINELFSEGSVGAKLALAFTYLFALYLLKAKTDSTPDSRNSSFDLRFSTAVTFSLFLSLQMVIYDLTILLLPFLLVLLQLKETKRDSLKILLILSVLGLYLEWIFRGDTEPTFIAARSFFAIWSVGLLLLVSRKTKAPG